MAQAVGRSRAHKILVPMNRCQVSVAGLPKLSMAEAVEAAVREAAARLRSA